MPRYCYVKDLKEKSDFVDATIRYNTTLAQSPLQELEMESWHDKKTTFSPCFFYALQANMAPTASSSVTFNYTVEYNFVFRNPKNGVNRFLVMEQIGQMNEANPTKSSENKSEIEPAATAAAVTTTTTLDESILPIANIKQLKGL